MSIGGRTFRAFRPSRFARQEDIEEEMDQIKEERIRAYAARVQAGLPLFESGNAVGRLSMPPNLAAM